MPTCTNRHSQYVKTIHQKLNTVTDIVPNDYFFKVRVTPLLEFNARIIFKVKSKSPCQVCFTIQARQSTL